jgi:hypothetical protein
MLFCCFSFQGFSLSTFSTKTVTRSGARVRRGRSSLFLSWGCSIFGLDRIPSFAQNGLFSPTREKYSSLLPSRKKFGSRRKRGGRKRGEGEWGHFLPTLVLQWVQGCESSSRLHPRCIRAPSSLAKNYLELKISSLLPEKGHILRGRTISHSKAKSFGLPKKSKVA